MAGKKATAQGSSAGLVHQARNADSSINSNKPFKDEAYNDDNGSEGYSEDEPLNAPQAGSWGSGARRARHSHGHTQNASRRLRVCNILKSKSCSVSFLVAIVFIVLLSLVATQLKKDDDDDDDGGEVDMRLPCGGAGLYHSHNETCTNGKLLCPIVEQQRLMVCGKGCFNPRTHYCHLEQAIEVDNPPPPPPFAREEVTCHTEYLHMSDPPYENYFMSDCGRMNQVVVTSPAVESDLHVVSPRVLVAWPSGNSGLATFFSPANGVPGSLRIWLEDRHAYRTELAPYTGGLTFNLHLESDAVLDLAIMGSLRQVRDYVEGGTLPDYLKKSQKVQQVNKKRAILSRLWIDGRTETFMTFQREVSEEQPHGKMRVRDGMLHLDAGTYYINAFTNHPQLEQLSSRQVLRPEAHALIPRNDGETMALSFLSYSSKVVAGAWRFLTYFGRDSLLSLLLLQPILSEGEGGAIETILGAALERINPKEGTVCHEEIVGDYASYLNRQEGRINSEPRCDYSMVDTDFYLAIAMNEYFVKTEVGRQRREAFMAKRANVLQYNRGRSYEELFSTNVDRVMGVTKNFEEEPTAAHLIHIKKDQDAGQWRDSPHGLAGGKIPYDVNTALAPAALRALASLANDGFLPTSQDGLAKNATKRAELWEDYTLPTFEVEIPAAEARDLVEEWAQKAHFPAPFNTSDIDGVVSFHGLALNGDDSRSAVPIMNMDDCFRLFLVNSTNESQLSSFLSQAADNILRPFPLGLSTPVGLLTANPAYTGGHVKTFSRSSYHGTVVWSWQMVMMAAGLERQLARCDNEKLDFCSNNKLHGKIVQAYSHLWDLLETNKRHLSSEVWSWKYTNGDFHHTPIGALAPSQGQSPVEGNIRQLWSLTFLAFKRNEAFSVS